MALLCTMGATTRVRRTCARANRVIKVGGSEKIDKAAGVPVRALQYQYDLVGNRQVVRDNGVPVMYTVNNMNQYTTVGGQPLSYDANGNLTSMPGLSLQYDSWNRLISAATESNLVLFAYDGRHRCVKRVEIQNGIGRTTIMVWGHEPSKGWGLLEERGANGEMLARHVHGPSVDELVLSELNGAVYYYHHDHLNSTIAVTDESGNVVEQYRYDAYGQPYFYGPDGTPRRESLVGLRFLFTGREWLSSLALYDYRHRAYSPSLGRFLQMDPVGSAAGEVNVYGYCHNLPCLFIDPYGLRVVFVGPNVPAGEQAAKYRELQKVMETGWKTEFTREFGNSYPFSRDLKELVTALEEAADVEVHIRAGPAYDLEKTETALGRTYAGKFPKGPIVVEVNPVALALDHWRETLVHELIHVLLVIHEKCPDSKMLKKRPMKEIIDILEKCRKGRQSLHNVFDYTRDRDSRRDLHSIIVSGLLVP